MVQYAMVQYGTVCYGTVWYSTVAVCYGTVSHGTVWYGVLWYGTAVCYGTVQYGGMLWYGMVCDGIHGTVRNSSRNSIAQHGSMCIAPNLIPQTISGMCKCIFMGISKATIVLIYYCSVFVL